MPLLQAVDELDSGLVEQDRDALLQALGALDVASEAGDEHRDDLTFDAVGLQARPTFFEMGLDLDALLEAQAFAVEEEIGALEDLLTSLLHDGLKLQIPPI